MFKDSKPPMEVTQLERERAKALGGYLERVRLSRNMKRSDVVNSARLYGANFQLDYYSKLERGDRSLERASRDNRQAIRQALGILALEWKRETGLHAAITEFDRSNGVYTVSDAVNDNETTVLQTRKFPVRELIHAGLDMKSGLDQPVMIDVPESDYFPGLELYRAEDDSMFAGSPEVSSIRSGDVLYVATLDRTPVNRGIYIVRASGNVLVRRVEQTPERGAYILRADNSRFPTLFPETDEIQFIGRVRFWTRRLSSE